LKFLGSKNESHAFTQIVGIMQIRCAHIFTFTVVMRQLRKGHLQPHAIIIHAGVLSVEAEGMTAHRQLPKQQVNEGALGTSL